ncbi:MAG: hypothetical protein OER80_08920 [Gammaproteobacteria bacterium]|nr:hypothetical protein [Gammaproteobacteria bacterium]MDH3766929.1 hypothetical protein [Gammaproteobacteria bacterium]
MNPRIIAAAAVTLVIIGLLWRGANTPLQTTISSSVEFAPADEPVSIETDAYGAANLNSAAQQDPRRSKHPRIATRPRFDPGTLYRKHLDAALAGDMESQFVLYEVSDYCRGAPRSNSDIERLETIGADDFILARSKQLLDECASLHEEIPDPGAAATQWYEAVSGAGHPLVSLVWRNQASDAYITNIKTALAHQFAEPFIRSRAYFAAAVLHAQYPEHADPIRQEAWFVLYCRTSPACNLDGYRADAEVRYHNHQIDDIFATAERIADHLDADDVEGALGF